MVEQIAISLASTNISPSAVTYSLPQSMAYVFGLLLALIPAHSLVWGYGENAISLLAVSVASGGMCGRTCTAFEAAGRLCQQIRDLAGERVQATSTVAESPIGKPIG